ncbi:hypothetical protein AA0229_2539 [Gluconobacter cerinus NRIC 0229]|nr:hypothetical protein AA0229_2539 [Gluconobacter cerinus NRIC 0229]
MIRPVCGVGLERKATDLADAMAFNNDLSVCGDGRQEVTVCLSIQSTKQGRGASVHKAGRQALMQCV